MNKDNPIPTVFEMRRIADEINIENKIDFEKMAFSIEFDSRNYTRFLDALMIAKMQVVPPNVENGRLYWADVTL